MVHDITRGEFYSTTPQYYVRYKVPMTTRQNTRDVNWAEVQKRPMHLHHPVGKVMLGDEVMCRGEYVPVTAIVVHFPDTQPTHIKPGYWPIEVRTERGSRWLGATKVKSDGEMTIVNDECHWTEVTWWRAPTFIGDNGEWKDT